MDRISNLTKTKRKTRPTAGEWWTMLVLYILLFGGSAYLGCTQGSEPAYAYPDFHATRVFIRPSPNKIYKSVAVHNDTTYSGLHTHEYNNSKINRFMNNMLSHPTVHGLDSLIHGNGYDTSFATASRYNHEMYKSKMVGNPEEGASYISKKGMPINQMLAHHKQYQNNVSRKAHHILKVDKRG